MSNITVVIFTENNARILTNPENIEAYKNIPNSVINPDLKSVEGVPPHLWKLVDGKVVQKTEEESHQTLEHIKKYGAINLLNAPAAKMIETDEETHSRIRLIVPYLVGAVVGSSLTFLLLMLV